MKDNISMEEVLDELQIRFLMNLPATELASSERLFFQIEQCYWFYEDFYADRYQHLQHMKLAAFAQKMFHHCVLLKPLKGKYQNMFQDFKAYQNQVPVNGCIMLNQARTKILLVRNWKGTSWTFPRGKINQGESDFDCAMREAIEECGYDASGKMSPNEFLEINNDKQRVRMYLVPDVPENYKFAPRTRKEISLIQFFEFDKLPKSTWCVLPFMARVKRWVAKGGGAGKSKKKGQKGNKNARSASAPRNRPKTKKNEPQPLTIAVDSDPSPPRSVSTPNSRPPTKSNRRQSRGHFGTEQETGTSRDVHNETTFGVSGGSFSVNEMFAVNESLTGQKFVYDGNPHDFGNCAPSLACERAMRITTGPKSEPPALAAPVAALFASASRRNNTPLPPKPNPIALPATLPPPPVLMLPKVSPPPSSNETIVNELQKDKGKPKEAHASSDFEFDTMDIMACVSLGGV